MKKNITAICAGLIVSLCACNSTGNNDANKDSANRVATDTAGVVPPMPDPDPADSVPAGRYGERTASEMTANIVRHALAWQLKSDLEKNIIDSGSRKFIFFEYDLNDDGKNEIFVGFTGPYFCGSGGCTELLLDSQGKLITQFTVSGYPVVIDNNKTNGWKDLFIQSGSKHHIMKFDGKKYPSNPSVQPELKLLPGDDLPRALDYMNEPYPWFRF